MRRYLLGLVCLGCATLASAQIKAPDYRIEQIVKPSVFHGVHGLTFDANDVLYAGSVVGETIYRVDIHTGEVEPFIGGPEGMADDLVFMPDGTLVWTSINQGVVRARKGNGPIRTIGEKLPGANSIMYRKSDGRLFMGQVFAGDGLWELDPTGAKPPRNILKNIGGLNGFDFGADGSIYGPLWFKKQIVKINPDTGELKVIAEGFGTPAAANFDSKGNLYVDDTARGELVRVDVQTGAKTVVAKLSTSLDNLAIDSKDRIFVSNMADNGIQEVDAKTGRSRQVVKGSLATPVNLAAVAEGTRDKLFVADVFAFRAVDGGTGRVTDIERAHAAGVHIEYPVAVTANARHALAISNDGAVTQFAATDGKFVREWRELGASSAIELNDGGIAIVKGSALVRVDANGAQKEIAKDLGAILGIALNGNAVYLANLAGGEILEVRLDNGAKKTIATGLKSPMGLALAKDGRILTIEFGKKTLTSVDPKTGKKTEIASKLPIGLHGRPDLPVGIAVGPSGAIYIASDVENSIYKLTRIAPR